jgi:L-lysine exporter family protein LysE/ArgO
LETTTIAFVEGFLLQMSLILALGAQNIFVIEAGMKKQNHLLVASVCSCCDMSLIFLGIVGTSTLYSVLPEFKIWIGMGGLIFLLFYALIKIKEAAFPPKLKIKSFETPSMKQSILIALGFSLLNPHVYLDTVVLIGGYAGKFSLLPDRFSFGAGASFFSIIWFFLLALSSGLLRGFLQSEKGLRFFSAAAGIILLILSYKLGADIMEW